MKNTILASLFFGLIFGLGVFAYSTSMANTQEPQPANTTQSTCGCQQGATCECGSGSCGCDAMKDNLTASAFDTNTDTKKDKAGCGWKK